jgi:hypothetical protein
MNKKTLIFVVMFIILLFSTIALILNITKIKNNVSYKIKNRIGYKVETNLKNDDEKSMLIWYKDYMNQYKKEGISENLIVKDYSITETKLIDKSVIEINFNVDSKKSNPKLEESLDGTYDSKTWKINCKWILKYKVEDENDKVFYTVTDVYEPSNKEEKSSNNEAFSEEVINKIENNGIDKETQENYDEIYKEQDDISKEEYNEKFEIQTSGAQLSGKNTYRIYNDKCSISYDGGNNWVDIDMPIHDLTDVSDGNTYYNKLQEGSFIIDPKRTILTYGGTREIPLSLIKSTDSGKTWKKITIDKNHEVMYSGRLKFISFVNSKTGFIVVTTERVMGTEAKAIFKTTDGGNTWTKVDVKSDINHHKLYKASFLTEKIGFMSMEYTQYTEIYRTEDGGITWSTIDISNKDIENYIQAENVYLENDKFYLLLSEGLEVNSTKKAKFISNDNGKTFKFTGKFEEVKTEY